ncbi:MAG: hypothetical protein ACFFDI_08895 [Promethearchaeota archaeon]
MQKVEGLNCRACQSDDLVEVSPKPAITLDVSFSVRVDVRSRVCLSCGHVEFFLSESELKNVLKERFKIEERPVQQYLVCPKCGGTNSAGNKFCVFCGQAL